MDIKAGPLLEQVNYPEELRENLTQDQLHQFCDELRQYIIDVVSIYGGHFGASLGTVEMTAAIHYVFNTPYDQLVWDVGHQAYGHKMITGRRDQFHTNRKYQGISGFPKIAESDYDTFGVGHSSTSVSAGLGMATASQYKGQDDRNHIVVIGDGAMSAGLSFEGLNNAGISDSNLLVILNDNQMSIDPNVGALKEYLTDISTSPTYNRLRDEVWKQLGHLSKFGKNAQEVASKIESSLKGLVTKESNFFEALNFRYFGPVDGHDVNHLTTIMRDLKNIPGPKLLHCVTTKGKGFKPSEEGDATLWHSPGVQFDKITGELFKKTPSEPQPPKYQDVFGKSIIELAKMNDKIMGITPAMPTGGSLKYMMDEMPDRAFDVGIAEQHAVTFSAGLATQGLRPVCNVYSTFMQRAYDQVIHDVAIQDLPVIFTLDRAGVVGGDGATHQGAYDIAYMRCLPNLIVSAPMNEPELRNLLYTAQLDKQQHPFSIRYPRGKGVTPDPEWQTPFEEVEIGKGRLINEGEELAVLSFGHPGNFVQDAFKDLRTDDIYPAHYDLRFVKPLDENLLHKVFSNFNKVMTVEDGCRQGGFGSAILEFMVDNSYTAQVKRLGIPDQVVEHGNQNDLWQECGIDSASIANSIREMMSESVKVSVSRSVN